MVAQYYLSPHPHLDGVIELLQRLIAVPSPSRQEQETADIWESWLRANAPGVVRRVYNNVFVVAPGFDPNRQTLLLNSHHDTVRPATSYTRNPYLPEIEGDCLYGLGSNDAGASGVSLASAYIECANSDACQVNLIFSITAAEEVMGELGMRAFLPYLKENGLAPDMVIVGEPTDMQAAVGERGLLVLDAVTDGVAGHAARNEGINAIYRAIEDIELLRNFREPEVSEAMGPIKISVTMINAGSQHNVVPPRCEYVVDVRTTDSYTNPETVELLRTAVKWSTLTPRSTRVQASWLSNSHPLRVAAENLGAKPFLSPTTSDMALLRGIPALKIGPGRSERSHSADEFVLISEINRALWFYPDLINNIPV